MKKLTMGLTLAILSTHCIESLAMFCPKGFNQINTGDTMNQVTLQCGPPDAKKTYSSPIPQPQEWDYFVKPDPSQSGTLKMAVVFDANQKVANITVNAQSLMSTPLCSPAAAQNNTPGISVGDSMEKVKAQCGQAMFVNLGQSQGNPSSPAPSNEITEFTYNTTPVTILTFENGKLK